MFGSPPLPHSPRKLANYHVKTRKNLSQEDFFYFYWLQFILTFPSEILLINRWYKYTGKLNFSLIHQKSSAECFRNRLSLPPLTSFGALLQVLLRPELISPFHSPGGNIYCAWSTGRIQYFELERVQNQPNRVITFAFTYDHGRIRYTVPCIVYSYFLLEIYQSKTNVFSK